ncbi:UNVERIFIED_CONTAM: hypothetical protein GTU68_003010 [Idotea baltica]|nr:hypothetical protein [Idotea baltica]
MSWLSFNYRVLLEAQDATLPLYERIKFLAIFSSNMDEFFHVRVASIQSLLGVKKKKLSKLSQSPEQLLEKIQTEVNRQQEVFGEIFRETIIPELKEHNINVLLSPPQLPEHQKFVEELFDDEVKVYLHPELLRKNKIVHFLRDDALYLAVKLRNLPGKNKSNSDVTPSSKKRIRFITLPKMENQHYIMLLDDVITHNLSRIFPGYELMDSCSIKLSRNADLQIEDEFSGDLVNKIKSSLSKRKIGVPSRFLYDPNMPKSMLLYLQSTFELSKWELMAGGTHHSFSDFFGFPNPLSPELEKSPTPPLPHQELEKYPSIFTAIDERNWVLHFPYHSYDYVIRFLNQAAIDPNVTTIHTTQYRVASNSAIVNALVRAASNGKDVTVFVEIKARFDEALNLRTAQEMEAAGVKIIYSFPGLKVHAKVALVSRMENGSEKKYAFLSTGNFNEKTAQIYADHGFLTADVNICNELNELFNYLKDRNYKPPVFQHLLIAQFNMRDDFLKMIDREIEHVKSGRIGKITIKLNNLEDEIMIDKLYEASQAGVEIQMIIRGICCLVPGVKGQSERITVRRIVDQFLEHARVFIFHNDGAEDMYLGSADWMKRNLSRRIEVIFPMKDLRLKEEIKEIIRLQLADNVKAVNLSATLENTPVPTGKPAIRVQQEIYQRIKEGYIIPGKTEVTTAN